MVIMLLWFGLVWFAKMLIVFAASLGWDLSSLKNVVKESLNDYFIQSTQSSNDDNGVKEENANSDSEEEKEKPKSKSCSNTVP